MTFSDTPPCCNQYTNSPDRVITRITLDYLRRVPPSLSEDGSLADSFPGHTERLCIDRQSATLELIQTITPDCRSSYKYEAPGAIPYLLDSFEPEALFAHTAGNPPDVLPETKGSLEYRITVDYQNGPSRIYTGSYDKLGLPEDFPDFAQRILGLIRFHGIGEALAPAVYGRRLRCQSDLIYCSVEFEDGYKTYYYISDDDSIRPGDRVRVPAGKDNHEAVVTVVKVEYFPADEAPLPPEKTKHILGKCPLPSWRTLEYYENYNYGQSIERTREELLTLLAEYEVREYSAADSEYAGRLAEGEILLEIVNPYRGENLFVKLGETYTLSFGFWHTHYSDWESHEHLLMEWDICDFLDDDSRIVSLWLDDKLLDSTQLTDFLSSYTTPDELLDVLDYDCEHLPADRLRLVVSAWRPYECLEYSLKPVPCLPDGYAIARQGNNSRLVIKDGLLCGRSYLKNYDDESSLIALLCLEDDEPNKEDITKALLFCLEEDARQAGKTRILHNIKYEELGLYSKLGYQETDTMDKEMLFHRFAVTDRYDMTVQKAL